MQAKSGELIVSGMSRQITLDTPITRGEQKIEKITLRKPTAGELRGVKLFDLMQMDVVALTAVIPRITDPTLTDHDVRSMDPADLMQCGIEVAGFLAPKSLTAESPSV